MVGYNYQKGWTKGPKARAHTHTYTHTTRFTRAPISIFIFYIQKKERAVCVREAPNPYDKKRRHNQKSPLSRGADLQKHHTPPPQNWHFRTTYSRAKKDTVYNWEIITEKERLTEEWEYTNEIDGDIMPETVGFTSDFLFE